MKGMFYKYTKNSQYVRTRKKDNSLNTSLVTEVCCLSHTDKEMYVNIGYRKHEKLKTQASSHKKENPVSIYSPSR